MKTRNHRKSSMKEDEMMILHQNYLSQKGCLQRQINRETAKLLHFEIKMNNNLHENGCEFEFEQLQTEWQKTFLNRERLYNLRKIVDAQIKSLLNPEILS